MDGPFLEVSGPEGQQFTLELIKDCITIGRFTQNDIALEPDPQQLITRQAHCTIERRAGGWWVIDNGSVNKTFHRRGTTIQEVNGRTLLRDVDSVRILGQLTEAGPLYWELIFHDPLGTRPAEGEQQREYLHYDWIQARLFYVNGQDRKEIADLKPQEHKLIRYMDQCNRRNGGVPVMCSYEELLVAIWGDEPAHTDSEINRLIWALRQKVEPSPKNPVFIETVRGLGYRMITRTLNS